MTWVHNIEADRWAGAYQRNPFPSQTQAPGLFLLKTIAFLTHHLVVCIATQRSALLQSLRLLRSWTDWQTDNRQTELFVRNLKRFNFWYVRKMFYAIAVKVITWLLFNSLRICQGVGWSFMQSFWNFHQTFFKLYLLEIFRQVGWLAWVYFSKIPET